MPENQQRQNSENERTEERIAHIRALRNGDNAAFSQLIRETQRTLYAIVWRMLRSQEEAADIVQEAYVKVYEHRDRLDVNQPVFPYLKRIAVNLALNRLRKLAPQSHTEQVIEHLPAEESAAGEVEYDELVRHVHAAVAGLPEEQRQVLELRLQERLSYQEIADRLNIKIGTVMSRLARAREKMMHSLDLWELRKKETIPL